MAKKIIIITILTLLVIGIPTGIFFYVKSKIDFSGITKKDDRPSITVLATLPPKSEKPQAEEEIEKKENKEEENIEEKKKETATTEEIKNDVKITVLNGGTASGSAGIIKKLLEDDKYSNVESADALSSSHVGQMVYHKKGLETEAEKIKDIVKEEYPEIESKEGKTAEQTSRDIVIMLGE